MIEQFKEHFDKLYQQPTAIQTAVADALAGDDSVLGIAPTGSGKTLAFTLPLLPKVMPGDGTQILVLSPSQELAVQTAQVMREWANLIGVKVQSLTGGANLRRQVKNLHAHPDVVVGTPGRVLHLLDNHKLKLSQLQAMVIDEADDMLQDDTLAVIEDIERATPINTQLAFFSATKSPVLDQLGEMFGRHVDTFDVRDTDRSRGPIQHVYLAARTNAQKAATLRRLASLKDFRALVFFNSTRTLHYAASRLTHEHVAVGTLGGRQRQTEREKAMRMFRKRQIKLLLTTDLAARGIDIPKLPGVINFDLPTESNTYVHRSGRTGRQGERGIVVNLGDDHDIRDLKKLVSDLDVEIKQFYIGQDKLTDEKPAPSAPVVKDKPVDQVKGPKSSAKSTPAEPSAPKKRRKKKNRKNKGIRLKHRRQNS
ncbi:MAG: DEAD/DEAH box helicase [Limosilactobacillus sp.]|uniref:DEAD/DEAH box helicase n=1 Tax=Limosilactobacillus sp. TaxID=2773925 RepID=UPI00270829A0|nr:DEAD/DEAH box helicase [Limosilactobacillus sp.]